MDREVKERVVFSMLGEFVVGPRGGAVYGWQRNLWMRCFLSLSGGHHMRVESYGF